MPAQKAKDHRHTFAFEHYQQLTMPPGALEKLFHPVVRVLAQREHRVGETMAISFCGTVFAGDHEVAAKHAVSAFPQEVTGQMLVNFLRGGAAMSVLCQQRGAPLYVVDVGVAHAYEMPPKEEFANGISFLNRNIANGKLGGEVYEFGSGDISDRPALSQQAFTLAFNVGREVAKRAIKDHNPDVFILGDMGIGNTTPATAIVAYLLDQKPADITGAGTGIGEKRRREKASLIKKAIARHAKDFDDNAKSPQSVLQSLGGFELAAIAGAACTAIDHQKHVLLDGLISTAAILPFAIDYPEFSSWLIASHASAEPAHQLALKTLGLSPLLQLDLRLGEGSGGAIAAGLMQDALAMLNHMATFQTANISGAAPGTQVSNLVATMVCDEGKDAIDPYSDL
jgi:nicotinate-nucleotide--dimethylbenzimidazole phosphoribosyltransferase